MQRRNLDPGTIVEGYVLGTMLGSGGFGTVYRARAPDGQEVAIKIGHPAARSTQQILRQQNEIEVLARLRHPSLVKVDRYGLTGDGRLFLTMELVEGVRLDQYLAQRRRLDVIEAVQIVRKVAETVAHCHAQGVLHLDLKPENIMLTEPHEPRLKVLDFGLAHLRVEDASGLGALSRGGTVPYMAPEYFIQGAALAPDPKLDLYAIGTILYELLSGELPFDAGSVGAVAERKREGEPRPIRDRVPSVPEPVAALVHALLARHPSARFGGAAALAARLKALYHATLAGTPSAGALPPAASGLPADDGDVPFVGRAAELELLAGALGDGAGGAVLVVGEPGLGKSRLVSEALRRRSRPAGITLFGRCRQLGDLVAYSPLREALGQLPRHAGLRAALRPALAAEKVVLAPLVPELYESTPAPSQMGDLAGDLAAFRLAGAERVAGALAAVLSATRLPVVMVLEDLHWADEGTLAALDRLLDAGVPANVLLLATSRRPDWRQDRLRSIALAPLPPADNDALLAALVGGRDPALMRTLKRSVPLLAGGNPLLVTQVVRSLELEGYVRRAPDGRVALGTRILTAYEPPDSVSAVLARAVARLPSPVREVLAAAALIGRQFPLDDLRALGLFADADVELALQVSQQQGLTRVAGGLASFVHDTVREHLEAAIPAGRLPEIHARIARQLERRGAPAGTLGRHLEQAGEVAAAAEAYLEAGLTADRLHDPRTARRHLERAYGLLARVPSAPARDTALARTVYELVRVGCALGDTAETLRTLDDCAARVSDAHGEPRDEVVAALESSYARLAYVRGDLAATITHSGRALAAVGASPALRSYQCFPANVVGRARCISGRFGEAIALLTSGSALARQVGEYGELSHSAGLLAAAHGFAGDYASARRQVEVCSHYARRLRDPVRILAAYAYRSAISEAAFDWDQGVKDSSALLAHAEEHGIGGLYLYVGTGMTGRHQFHVGNLGRARVLLANALNLSTVMRMASIRSWFHAYLGDVHFVGGDLQAARAEYREGLARARSMNGDELAEPMCLAGLAHVEALVDGADRSRVATLAGEAVARLQAVGSRATLVTVLQRYAEALEATGDEAGARAQLAAREVLVRTLGLGDCDFWPRLSTVAGEAAASRREHWRLHARTMPEAGATVARGCTTYVTLSTVLAEPSGDSALLESLATIEGYVPGF